MIKEYLEKSESLPYLFIGSGFSKRYLNLPNWENLLEEVADLVYDNKFKLAQKKNLAKKEFNPNTHYNQYMTYLCDLISNDLDLIWYDDDKFKESRDKYSDLVITSGVLPIKIEIAKIIKKNNKVLEKMKPELEIFKQLTTHSIGGIITTNYDSLIEDIFDFEVYRTQQQLLFQKNHEIGEIYKIHGCVTEPETIMITSEDYQMIEEKNKYLAAKLLTIFIEHPIVFIGYSINDEDIKNILFDITKCLNEYQKEILEERLIFINWNPNIINIQEETRIIEFSDRTHITIKSFSINKFDSLYLQLAKIKSKYPVKLLRTLKKDMYELALSETPTDKIMISLPPNDLTDEEYSNLEYVFGFGVMELAKKGYSSPRSQEIYYDIILDNCQYNADSLLLNSFPSIEKHYGTLPRFKYIKSASKATQEYMNSRQDIPDSINYFLNRQLINRKIKEKSIQEILNNYNDNKSIFYNILSLEPSQIDCEELGKTLKDILSTDSTLLNEYQNPQSKTNLRKLIKIYDWLKYK